MIRQKTTTYLKKASLLLKNTNNSSNSSKNLEKNLLIYHRSLSSNTNKNVRAQYRDQKSHQHRLNTEDKKESLGKFLSNFLLNKIYILNHFIRYPAGFVYIYSLLYWITNQGTNLKLAQYIFIGSYLVFMGIILDSIKDTNGSINFQPINLDYLNKGSSNSYDANV